ncbi:MAG: hypothetical protein HW388_412 [Dehalococcoidia bacterium]|nr:hypothetical protein [Dehalococcoidia bacterium]
MGLVRCDRHGAPMGKRHYVRCVDPLGYPQTAAICGLKDCYEPGRVWLDEDDVKVYNEGRRVIDLPTAAAKVEVEYGECRGAKPL